MMSLAVWSHVLSERYNVTFCLVPCSFGWEESASEGAVYL